MNRLAAAGPFSVEIVPTSHNPVVYAEWLVATGAPTILIYGHKMCSRPIQSRNGTADPFVPVVRDG